MSNGSIGASFNGAATGDFNGDGKDDILWHNPSGQVMTWLMNGINVTSAAGTGTIEQAGGWAASPTPSTSTLNEMGKVVTDFHAGAGGGILDLRDLLIAVSHGGTNALTDGTVRLIQHNSATELQVDIRPGNHNWLTAATLPGVIATALVPDNFIL